MVRVFRGYNSEATVIDQPNEGFDATLNFVDAATAAAASASATVAAASGTATSSNSDLSSCNGRLSSSIFYGEDPIAYPFSRILLEFSLLVLIIGAIRFILKPLRQPRVVAEILGGIIIGPSVLGHNRKFREELFPDSAIFVVRNIGLMGFMYFLFVSGVKTDMSVIMKKIGKRNVYTALVSVAFPMVTTGIVGLVMRGSMEVDEDLAKITSIGSIASSLAITSFPVLYHILKEQNLLSSELGRMALSVAVYGDLIGITAILIFEATTQAEVKAINALWYMLSLIGLIIFMLAAVRPMMKWIVHRHNNNNKTTTPPLPPAPAPTSFNNNIDQGYVVAIFAGVLVIGFFTDLFGIAIANGPLWLGLIIPDGPPLGSVLVERCETIVMELLMPFAFAHVGLLTDVSAMCREWSSQVPLLIMALTGYISKIVGTLVPALFFKVPLRESLALSFIMGLRGQVEFLLYLHWMDKKIIKQPSFTLMVLLTTVVTALILPVITILYDPTRPYMVNKRRNIQHAPPTDQLGVVMCIYDQDNLAAFLNLLHLSSNPMASSPFLVYALHLIELIGRASPVFIDHNKDQEAQWNKYPIRDFDTIHNALMLYQESRRCDDLVHFNEYTAVSPKRTMYQDICELALVNKANLIILPFHRVNLDPSGTISVSQEIEAAVNLRVLATAPCSVAILVDRGHYFSCRKNPMASTSSSSSSSSSNSYLALLFLGGADAREALVYADRMLVGKPDVSLTIIRFLSHNGVGDDEIEKKLDDGVVTSFWVKNEGNDRVTYREVIVGNGNETVAAVQAINDDRYHLWITGRKQGVNPVLLDGLTSWTDENQELGIIGDYLSSADFGSRASVLVVQQQMLREQRMGSLDRLLNIISSIYRRLCSCN